MSSRVASYCTCGLAASTHRIRHYGLLANPHHALNVIEQIAIAVKCSDHVGALRGFLPWGL